jgi:lipopolysaccharide transport system permease protein
MIPEKYKYIIDLNPLTPLMISWRTLFLNGTLDPISLMISLGYSVVVFILGCFVYRKLSHKFAEAL